MTGKWLFPTALVDAWLAEHMEGERPRRAETPPVVAGSQDPLLEWAVKESGCGLALLPGGSLDGLRRLTAGQARVAGLHLFHAETGTFNVPMVRDGVAGAARPGIGTVLIEWAWRRQGLVLPAGNPAGVERLADLVTKGLRVVRRQQDSGSGLLLAYLLAEAGLAENDLRTLTDTAKGETDLGLAILEGRADAGMAVEAVARSLKLDFLPLMWERYDLLMARHDYFEAAVQTLLRFTREPAFTDRTARLGGYDVSGLGTMRYNGP